MYFTIILTISAVYLLFMGLATVPGDMISSVIFKVIPTILGISLFIEALNRFGVL